MTNHNLVAKLVLFCRLNMVVVLGFVVVAFVSAEEIMVFLNGADAAVAAPAIRILCLVAALRAVSFVLPPFLDGAGRPDLSLRYAVVAAVVLPSLFVGSALLFGDRLGYLSVAWAWAIGYPIAFAVLLMMALSIVDLRLATFTRQVAGVWLCAGLTLPMGFAAKLGLAGATPGLRFAVVVATCGLVFGLLLARITGISPRSIKRSLSAQ